MAKLNPVLVLDEEKILKIVNISNDNIPKTLNGESGFHIYHVRMLTELILRQLAKINSSFKYNEEEIVNIAMASTLHDIGKEKIPKSILEYKGNLSSFEYDIVKKHAVFGEEIISELNTDIDPQIIKYAKEIAKNHHERYDGMGYPDGLKGDEIPLSAQVVSIADVFDALTSTRSYKKAISQDVAIEMITNGMCGSFQPDLIEALLLVVNHNDLVEIREQFLKHRSVFSEKNSFVPKRVLLAGNIGYLTEEFIKETFYESNVAVVGKTDLKSTKKIKVYNVKDPSYSMLFGTYEFDLVIYFASELTYDSSQNGDSEQLKSILTSVADSNGETKFLYFSSLEVAFEGKSGKSLLADSKEKLCIYYRDTYSIDLKIVRLPYFFSGTNKNDFLYSIFDKISDNTVVKLNEKPSYRAFFISQTDLSELIIRYIDNWQPGDGILTVNDDFNISFSDLAEKLAVLKDNVKIDFIGEENEKILQNNNKAIRNKYGWFSKISILTDLEEQYENYLVYTNRKVNTLFERFKLWLSKNTIVLKLAELFSLFIITEIIILLTGSSTHFSIVDFRMAFIVIMATIHGLGMGIAAAGLSSVSWLISKLISGTSWITIFYEPTNWFAFIYYFLIGALCGYVRIKSGTEIANYKQQNKLLEEKLIFNRELYEETSNEKRSLKKQIIASKDSFGKIYDITRQLETVEPRELYLKIMNTFETVLENKSISVYSVSKNSIFGRLEVASRDIINSVSRSVSLETFEDVLKQVKNNEIWKNTELKQGLPMYAAGVSKNGEIELLIFIWHAAPDQRSLYYVNLFKILCDLVQMSLLRAYDYSQAIYNEQYIDGTRILNTDAFEKVLENFKKMAERKVFSYVHLLLDCKDYSYKEIDSMLVGRVRINDILGVDPDGKVVILLSQATKDDLSYILPRFENLDIDVSVF